VETDAEIKKEFKKHLGDVEIYKFIKDTIEKSQNILLVIDDDKKELPEIRETYVETWGKMVKPILIKKFTNGDNSIYTMHPDFENIELPELATDNPDEEGEIVEFQYDEAHHLDGASDTVRKIYDDIKSDLLKTDTGVIFNPQKYYISIKKKRNIAYFDIKKKKIGIIVRQSDTDIRNDIRNYSIKVFSLGAQKFWNPPKGPSCGIIIDNDQNLDEIKRLLRKLVAQN